jgi:hypothetical protein
MKCHYGKHYRYETRGRIEQTFDHCTLNSAVCVLCCLQNPRAVSLSIIYLVWRSRKDM